ncbi:hypothetical protein Nepgr_001317 [Nepenthes gracilis]|uniref:AB hydrolase-1 domain-containing protein n=1 Tax=Nepenthes gracilis TaxID=150966 RepID=A0AAD3RXH2_NEPGR|nr:hypothetical protein Nepgr_001317 [Nepenthes gracilis]
MLKKVGVMLVIVVVAWVHQSIHPPPPKICGSPGGPAITAPRIKLRDGRYLAYKESGVPKESAKFKIIFVHGFDCCRHDAVIATHLPKGIIEELGLHVVSYDRSGYGESDPNPKLTAKSMALDVEELADLLGLGDKFYLVGFSMGGQTLWSSLKYIPHRLAGVALLAPVVNYWWSGLATNISKEAFQQQLPQDQWATRVAHYTPWLTYWWNTQKFFPSSSVASRKPDKFNLQDLQLITKILPLTINHTPQVRQQGEFESIHRDMMVGFGKWEFSPLDLTNPFKDNKGSVHLWQGDEDGIVSVKLQRHVAETLPWIQYHEIAGGGHLFPYAEGMVESILKALTLSQK